MKKTLAFGIALGFLLAVIVFVFPFCVFPVNAQSSNNSIEVQAGITPDSPFWGLERVFERIQLFFTFNQEKKVELRLLFANERLAEIRLMLQKNNAKAAEKAEKARTEEIEEIESLKVDNRTRELIAERLQKHILVLQEVLNESPESAREGLENALNKSSKVLAKFEVQKEKPISQITEVINITCGYCQYLVNDTCLNYSCCKDGECKGNEACYDNECIPLNCTSCQYAENHKCVDYECCKNEDCGVNKTCIEHACFNIEEKCPPCDPPYVSPTTGNICEYYYCNASTHYVQDYTKFYCATKIIKPCCGNNYCEISKGESEENCPADCQGISKFLYCEYDEDCSACCGNGQGRCMNKNYSCFDYPTYFSPNLCGKEIEAMCQPCGCVNNQCRTVPIGAKPYC